MAAIYSDLKREGVTDLMCSVSERFGVSCQYLIGSVSDRFGV
jgi:hypothetical protein